MPANRILPPTLTELPVQGHQSCAVFGRINSEGVILRFSIELRIRSRPRVMTLGS